MVTFIELYRKKKILPDPEISGFVFIFMNLFLDH